MTILRIRKCCELAAVTLAAAAFLVAGCGGGGGDGGPTREQQILAAVAKAGKVVPVGPNSNQVTATETLVEGDFKNTYEKHDAVKNMENVVYFGLNDDLIWPGALVKGTRAHDFVFEPISVPRGPITLSASLEGSGSSGPLSARVDDPKLSTVRQGIADLLRGAITAGTTIPARVDYDEERVSNASHMSMFLGADVSYGGASLSSLFDWQVTTERNRVLVKYTQIYYTVDLDTPTGPLSFFAAGVSAADAAAAMPPGSMPLYVASVGYGMMAIMAIETDFTEEEMGLAMDAAYSGTVDAQIRFGYTAKDILQRSTIKIKVYGGSTKGLGDIETAYDGFLKVIRASQQYGADTPGVPIFYKFRHVADNTLALVSLTSQYTVVRPLQIAQRVIVRAERFVCEMSDDEGVANNVDMNKFGVWTTAYQGNPLMAIPPGQQAIYWYQGTDINMPVGSIHTVGQEVAVTFDTEQYDLADARLDLRAYANDFDPWPGADEWDDRTLSISGRQFFESGGKHDVYLYSADFRFRVEFTLADGTRP